MFFLDYSKTLDHDRCEQLRVEEDCIKQLHMQTKIIETPFHSHEKRFTCSYIWSYNPFGSDSSLSSASLFSPDVRKD